MIPPIKRSHKKTTAINRIAFSKNDKYCLRLDILRDIPIDSELEIDKLTSIENTYQ